MLITIGFTAWLNSTEHYQHSHFTWNQDFTLKSESLLTEHLRQKKKTKSIRYCYFLLFCCVFLIHCMNSPTQTISTWFVGGLQKSYMRTNIVRYSRLQILQKTPLPFSVKFSVHQGIAMFLIHASHNYN